MRRIPRPCRTRNFLSFIFRLKLFGGSFSFRARKTNMHSCCWKMSSGSICRVSIMVLTFAIRVTRDAEFGLVRRRNEDLLMTIEQGVRERRMGDAVRLQYDPDLPKELLTQLMEELELTGEDLYPARGFTSFTDLMQLYTAANIPRLKDRPQAPLSLPSFGRGPDIWNTIRSGDVMIVHPYQSFDPVTRFF